MNQRGQHRLRTSLLMALYGLMFHALASGGAVGQARDNAALHLEIDLAAARTKATASEFMQVDVEEISEWLYPAVIPENSAYCLEPDPIGDRCLVPPHTLVLQLSLGNRLENRILDASFSLVAPELVLLDARGPRYVPSEGWFLPFARLRYDSDLTASGSHRIEVGLLQPTEARRVYLLVAFPQPPAAPDRLRLEFMAKASELPVEEEELLTRLTFKPGRPVSTLPRDGAPGVQLFNYNAGQGGTVEITEVSAPGLLAHLPSGVRRVAPLYRFRTEGLRGQYQALFPLERLQEVGESEVVCSARLSGGQWTLTPVERMDSGAVAVEVSVEQILSDRTGVARDRYVTLVVTESPDDGRADECPIGS